MGEKSGWLDFSDVWMPRKTFEFGPSFLLSNEVNYEYSRLVSEANGNPSFGVHLPLEKFWAREHAAFVVHVEKAHSAYADFLPGRLFTYSRLVDVIRERIYSEHPKVLEMGSGSGLGLALLGQQRCQCAALDIAVTAINFSRAMAAHFGSNLEESIVSDFNQIPSRLCKAFDLVFNLGAFEHRTDGDQVRLFTNMTACSKRWVIVVVPNQKSPIFQAMENAEFDTMPLDMVYPEEVEIHGVDFNKFDGIRSFQLCSTGAFHFAPPRRMAAKTLDNENSLHLINMVESVRRIRGPLIQRWLHVEREFVTKKGPEVCMNLGWFKYGIYEKLP